MSRKMFTPLLTIVFLVAAARADSVESPIPTLCDMSQLKSDLDKVPFVPSSLKCSDVWKEKDFVLMFHITDDFKTWTFVLSAPTTNTTSYIAIGFSKDGKMVGSSAVAGWLQSNGKGTVKKYSLDGMTKASDVVPDKGNLVLKSDPTIVSKPKRLYLAFQLDASNNQPSSKLLYATGKAPASGDLLSYHEANRISTTITFMPEGNNTAPAGSPAGSSGAESAGPPKNSPGNSAGRFVLTAVPAFSALLAVLLF